MTEKQKKLAIIVGTIVIALILLLSSRKASGDTIINRDGTPIQFSIPSLNMPERSQFAINIPGLPSFTPYQYSAISPCMCNGASVSPLQNQGPLVSFVTNQGNSGPNIYNYTPYVYKPPSGAVGYGSFG